MLSNKKCSARSRVWLAVVYNLDKFNEVDFMAFSRIQGFVCSPLHDSDVNEDGSKKVPHYHLILKFGHPVTFSGAKYEVESFITTENVRVEICKDVYASYDYLTHTGFDDKFQYTEVIQEYGDCSYFKKMLNDGSQNGEFLADLISLSAYEMACKYGRDYIRNYQKYNDFARLILNEGDLPDEDTRFANWLRVYRPDFEVATKEHFRKFESINGMFII